MQSRPTFTYLLVNHVPFGPGQRPGRLRVGAMWLHDLGAQRDALAAVGGRLLVACPLAPDLDLAASGSFDLLEIEPAEHGFEYVPLPYYRSLGGWLRSRGAVRRTLSDAVARAEVVHLGDGAHPIALDEIGWPLAGREGRLRVWVYDGADVLPRMMEHAESRQSPLARAAWRWLVRRRERFSRAAIRQADLVFAHNAAVVERFAAVWDERCHAFDRSFVTEDSLISEHDLDRRERDLLDTSQPLRLVAAGRQIRIKGTDQVLRAMAEAARQGARMEFDVYGEGQDLDQYRRLAQELGLADRVRFQGAVPFGKELFERLSRSQVMMLTNLTPEISRNVLLAMALGLPLIGYRNPGTDALISTHGAGTLVEAGDIEGLAGALVRASRERAELARQARSGRAVAAVKTLEACHRERAELVAAALAARAS